MKSKYFPPVRFWRISKQAFADSLRELARDGTDGNEGIILWLGKRDYGMAEISHLVALRGPGVVKRPYSLQISPELLNQVTDLTLKFGVSMIGQMHSHGPGSGVGLSSTDRDLGISVPHYLSVVAPYFGRRPATRVSDCGVHVFEPRIGYRRLSRWETWWRIRVVQSPSLPVLIVGETGHERHSL